MLWAISTKRNLSRRKKTWNHKCAECQCLNSDLILDIMPTFAGGVPSLSVKTRQQIESTSARGDLFSDLAQAPQPEHKPFHESDEFIFALKFTHIHVFGMSGIFIVMGTLAVFLDRTSALKAWLVILPFIGIVIDLAGVWLKLFIHPAFFWLHIPDRLMNQKAEAIQFSK